MEAPPAVATGADQRPTNPVDAQFMLRYPRINANFRKMDVSIDLFASYELVVEADHRGAPTPLLLGRGHQCGVI